MGLIGLKIATKWGYLVSSLTLGGGYPSRATPPGYPPGWPPGGGWAPPEPTPVNREGWHFSPGTPGIRGEGRAPATAGARRPGFGGRHPEPSAEPLAPGEHAWRQEFYIENSMLRILHGGFSMENSLLDFIKRIPYRISLYGEFYIGEFFVEFLNRISLKNST